VGLRELGPDDPRRIDDYDLLAVLGSGGMGKVYLGRDGSGRHVAVKRMNAMAKAMGATYLERFRKELEAARRVSAEFTPPVRAYDLQTPDPWVAVDYVGAPTLRELVERLGQRLPVSSVAWLAESLLRVLRELRLHGIIHRDLHPANILVTERRVLVIDFGLARDLSRPATTPYVPFGTPGYMAPEQRDDVEEQTSAVDVYAFGASMAYAATSSAPRVDHVFLVVRDTNGAPRMPDLPDGMRELIHACMQREWQKRPDLEELERLVRELGGPDSEADVAPLPSDALGLLREYAEMPVDERPELRKVTRPWTPPSPFFERYRPSTSPRGEGYVRLSVRDHLLVAAGLSGAVRAFDLRDGQLLWRFDMGSRAESRPAVGAREVVVCGSDQSLHVLDVRTGNARASLDLGYTIGSAPLIVGRRAVLGDRSGHIRAIDLDSSATLWAFEVDHSVHARPTATTHTVLVGSWNRSLYALDITSGRLRWIHTVRGEIHESAVITDGRALFGAGDRCLRALDSASGALLWEFFTGGPVHCEPAVHRGAVYFTGSDGCLYAARTEDGTELWRALVPGLLTTSPLLWGERVYVGGAGAVYSFNIRNGGDFLEWPVESGPVVDLAIHSAHTTGRLFAGTANGQIMALSLGARP
jgi:eukaryotic-like serine/threonine-protein kinase